MALPEVLRGLTAGAGGVFRLPRRLPRAIAIEMLLTGRSMLASEALAFGLVNKVVADDKVLEAAVELAQAVAAAAPVAVQEALAMARISGDFSDDELWRRSAAMTARVVATEDAKEGAIAFVEERQPQWKGC